MWMYRTAKLKNIWSETELKGRKESTVTTRDFDSSFSATDKTDTPFKHQEWWQAWWCMSYSCFSRGRQISGLHKCRPSRVTQWNPDQHTNKQETMWNRWEHHQPPQPSWSLWNTEQKMQSILFSDACWMFIKMDYRWLHKTYHNKIF